MVDLFEWISQKAEDALRALLETKHLYQSVVLSRDVLIREAQELQLLGHVRIETAIDDALESEWHAHDERSLQLMRVYRHDPLDDKSVPGPTEIRFDLPNIKSPCAQCESVTPFNLIRVIDLYSDSESNRSTVKAPKGRQDFAFLFECQSCRLVPDAFLVRRRGAKLTLCGRAPMEHVQVPEYIPRAVRKHYSNATVAFQSGQVLAAVCLLRVLIEQHAREKVPGSEGLKPDEVLDKYKKQLNQPNSGFNDKFPSLGDVYGRLSAAIHSASDDPDIFESSRDKVDLHFDGLRIFEKIKGKSAAE